MVSARNIEYSRPSIPSRDHICTYRYRTRKEGVLAFACAFAFLILILSRGWGSRYLTVQLSKVVMRSTWVVGGWWWLSRARSSSGTYLLPVPSNEF